MKKYIQITICLIILFFLVLAGLYMLINSRSFQVFGELIRHVDTHEKVVALTFDDGPTDQTVRILQYLVENKVKATFFLAGSDMEKHPEYAMMMALQGHQLANHSYTHTRMIFSSPSFIKNELKRTDELITKAGYRGEIVFRPPYGKKLITLPWVLSSQNKKTIMWSQEVDSSQDSSAIADSVIHSISPGDIILLHAMYNQSDLDAIPKIISGLREQGYTFLTVNELLQYQGK